MSKVLGARWCHKCHCGVHPQGHDAHRRGSRRLVSKVKGAISDPETFLKDQLKLSAVDTLELCLVCEVCWRPQRDDAYDVTTQSDLCAKVCA